MRELDSCSTSDEEEPLEEAPPQEASGDPEDMDHESPEAEVFWTDKFPHIQEVAFDDYNLYGLKLTAL